MVTKNRLAASRGRTPQAHVRSETRLLASKVAADMSTADVSTADVLRPPRQFRRGETAKKRTSSMGSLSPETDRISTSSADV